MPRLRRTAAALGLAAATLACAAVPAPAAPADRAAPGVVARSAVRHVVVTSPVMAEVPSDLHLHEVATARGLVRYGTLRLVGPTVLEGEPAQLEVLASAEYVDGNGPAISTLNVTSARGSLALTYTLHARVQPDGSTVLRGVATVAGGTGAYAGTTGCGSVLAVRSGVVGAAVAYTVSLDLRDGTPRRFVPVPFRPVHHGARASAAMMGDPADQHFRTYADGRLIGIGRLTGATRIAGAPVDVELLAVVTYRHGTGPFTGFITFTDAHGGVLGMRYAGTAYARADGSTVVRGDLVAIAGTGRWTGVHGRGTVIATRSGVIGSPLMSSFVLDLHR